VTNKLASVNAIDKEGKTPLHVAAFYGYTEIAIFLLDAGADLEAKNNTGTSLCIAVWEGRNEVVELFLERNADVEASNSLQSTPLLLAAWKGHESILCSLLVYKANIEARNYYQETALIRAATSSRTNIVKLLLEHKASTLAVDAEGRSAMHKAAIIEVAQLLLEANMELLRLPDSKSFTPLHWAVYHGQFELVKFYLKSGANVNLRDKFGRTPFEFAQETFKDSHTDIIVLLKQYQ